MEAKLYSPVFVDLWEFDEYGSYNNDTVEISQRAAVSFFDEIQTAIHKYRMPEESERGLMAYYDEPDTINEKVRSIFIDVEIHGGRLWGVTTLDISEPLESWELEALCNYITGQFSDGWGEGFEQQEIRVDDGEINVHFWKHGELFLDTQERFSQRLGLSLPPDALSHEASVSHTFADMRPESQSILPEDFDQVVEGAAVAEVEAEMLAEARQRLVERARQNWDDFRSAPHNANPENIYHQAIKVVSRRDACQFIKDYDGFTAEQINCLLQFADPVDLVGDYLDPKSEIDEMPGILASIRVDQENLKQHYALARDPAAPGIEELEQRLRDRLSENYSVYKRDMLDLSKEELFKSAAEVASVSESFEYFTQEHGFTESEVDFLFKFENPLELISDKWDVGLRNLTHTLDSIFSDQERTLEKGGYTLMPDEPAPAPAAPELPQKATESGEKLSVIERIRQAAKEARERPNATKDTPGHKKPGPEL